MEGAERTKEETLKAANELRQKSIDKGNAADKAFQAMFEADPLKRNDLLQALEKDDYAWMTRLKDMYMDRWNIDTDSMVHTQATFYSKLFNTTFKPDILIYYDDGKVGIREIKTEGHFADISNFEVMRYGNTRYLQILNTKESQAKMQVMLMAFMMKAENPNIVFRDLGVDLILSNEKTSSADQATNFKISSEEVLSFLEMIDKYLSQPDNIHIKKELIANGIYEKLLSYKEYTNGSVYWDKITKDKKTNIVLNSEATVDAQLRELSILITENEVRNFRRGLLRSDDSDEGRRFAQMNKAKLDKLKSLTESLYNMYTVNEGETLNSVLKDMDMFSKMIASLTDSSNPLIASFNKLWQHKLHEFTSRKNEKVDEFLSFYIPVLNEQRRANGLSELPNDIVSIRNNRNTLKQYLNNRVTHNMLFDRLSIRIKKGNLTYVYLRRPNKENEASYFEGLELEKPLSTLTQAEIALLKWINDYNDSIFTDVVKEGNVVQRGLANRVRSENFSQKQGRSYTLTELDYFNNKMYVNGKDATAWSYNGATGNGKFGFFPKTMLSSEEINEYSLFGDLSTKGIKQKIKNFLLKNATVFLEDQVKTGNEDDLPGLHLRFLGGEAIDTYEGRWSKSVEKSMVDFIDANLRLELLQDVYAFGTALVEYAKHENTDLYNNEPLKKNVIEVLDKLIKYNLKGIDAFKAISTIEDTNMFKKIITIPFKNARGEYVPYRISIVKLMHYLKNRTSLLIMGYAPLQAFVNFIQTLQASMRVALGSKVMRTLFLSAGMNPDELDFGVKDYLAGYKLYLTGNNPLDKSKDADKLFLLTRELRYLPDSYDWSMSDKSYITKHMASNKGSIAFILHSAPEEANAMAILYAILKNRKHNGKSLFDLYDVEETVEGNRTLKKLVWKGGIRGKEKIYDGMYKNIEGITAKEGEAFRSIYRNIQGGYRHDERTYLELTVFGNLFLQFRRFLPSYLKRMFQTQRNDYSQGFYEWQLKDGENIAEWKYRNIEGRFMTLARFLLSGVFNIAMSHIPVLKNTAFSKYMQKYGDRLTWNDMTPQQKINIIESFVSIAMWGTMFLLRSAASGDDDKKNDAVTKILKRIEKNAIQSIDPRLFIDLLNNGLPASFTTTGKAITGYSTLFSSMFLYAVMDDKESVLTKEGLLPGLRQSAQSTTSFGIAPLYKLIRFGEDYDKTVTEYWDDLIAR